MCKSTRHDANRYRSPTIAPARAGWKTDLAQIIRRSSAHVPQKVR